MKKTALAILIIFALFCDLPAKTYIWTDEKGVTHISDRPPKKEKIKPPQPEQNNEQESTKTKITNAAIYYSKALEMLNYPVDEKSKQKIGNAIKKGWDPKDEALENVIKDNKLCLKPIEKAKALTDCNFGYKKPYKYLIEKEIPPSELFSLHGLLLLNARYYEHQKNWNRATNSFFSALILAYHMSQDNSESGIALSLAFESITYPVLREYLQTATSNIESTKISEFLNDHKKRHFPAKALVDKQKEEFLSSMQMIADGMVENGDKMGSKAIKIKFDDFAKEFMKQANQLSNEYYGYFAKAVESNKEEDWQKASNAYETITNSAQPELLEDLDYGVSRLFNTLTGDIQEKNKIISRKILITLLAVSKLDEMYALYAEKYYKAMDELNELLVMADKKAKE